MQLPAQTATLMHVFILPQTRRSNYSDNDGAASDGEPDRRGKEVPGRAKAKVPARKVQPLSSCSHILAALLIDLCQGYSSPGLVHENAMHLISWACASSQQHHSAFQSKN